jgi:hypothetical protein
MESQGAGWPFLDRVRTGAVGRGNTPGALPGLPNNHSRLDWRPLSPLALSMKNCQPAVFHACAILAAMVTLSVASVPAFAQVATPGAVGPSGTMQTGAFVQQPSANVGAAYAAGQVTGNPYGTGYAQYGTVPYGQNQARPDLNPKSPTEVKPEDTAKAALSDKTHVPTAAEQGLRDTRIDAALQWQVTREAQDNSARQRGERVVQAETPTPVSASRPHRGWLANWEKTLTASGVGLEKVRFEENRLDADEFARWASNQLRYTVGPQPTP